MGCWKCAAAGIAILGMAGCVQVPNSGLSDEARAGLNGRELIRAVEPHPEGVRRINKPGFIAAGGGLIGLAVVLTATAVVAVAENAASDVDAVQVPEADLAARVETRVMADLVAETGVLPVPAVLEDPEGRFLSTAEGIGLTTKAAQAMGYEGAVLNVITLDHGIVSGGAAFQSGDEAFVYAANMRAVLIDAAEGTELARGVCNRSVQIGTLEEAGRSEVRVRETYAKALSARQEAEASLASVSA
ncbi:MAG: hypothetical protein AAGI13_11915, partial [Pseudomonadota bacterium]